LSEHAPQVTEECPSCSNGFIEGCYDLWYSIVQKTCVSNRLQSLSRNNKSGNAWDPRNFRLPSEHI